MRWYTLDKDNEPVLTEMLAAAHWLEDERKKPLGEGKWKVGNDRLEHYSVSTVFLGLDHSYSENGRPILFETLILCTDGTTRPLDNWTNRYYTWQEAEEGHRYALDICMKEIAEEMEKEREQQRAEASKKKALDDKYAASKGPRKVKL